MNYFVLDLSDTQMSQGVDACFQQWQEPTPEFEEEMGLAGIEFQNTKRKFQCIIGILDDQQALVFRLLRPHAQQVMKRSVI